MSTVRLERIPDLTERELAKLVTQSHPPEIRKAIVDRMQHFQFERAVRNSVGVLMRAKPSVRCGAISSLFMSLAADMPDEKEALLESCGAMQIMQAALERVEAKS